MIALGVALRFAVGPLWRLPLWLRLLGIPALLGVLVARGAIARFRKTGQSPTPWSPTPELIFDGPYRWTRNPMYVGMTLLTVGIGLLAGVLWISLLAFAALLVVHFVAVLPEERY